MEFKSELDPEVLKDALPANVHAIVDQVAANVNVAVKDLLDGFTKNIEQTIKDFESGNYPIALKSRLNQIEGDVNIALNDMDKNIAKVRDAANAANEAARANNSKSLMDAVNALNMETGNLERRLQEFRDKTAKLGSSVGGATATALKTAIMG